MNEYVLVKHPFMGMERSEVGRLLPDYIRKCADEGILIVEMPECSTWIGRRVEPFKFEVLEISL